MTEEEAGLRRLMFSISYRMTGSVSDAEDIVQEAYVRLDRSRRSGVVIGSPKAFLAATTTRLAIDQLRSARARRESYVGTWFPEPIVTDLQESPEHMAELSDSLSMAFLVLLESLSPVERAVFLLREVLGYDYGEIAQIVDKSETNCRQIFARSRRHLDAHQVRYAASAEQNEALVRSFISATRDGNLDQLVALLATDAVFSGDGGGKATAVSEPVHGRERIAPLLIGFFDRAKSAGVTAEPVHVNGGPGILNRDAEGKVVSVLSVEVRDGVIQTLRSVVNPDKLRHLGPVSNFLRVQEN